MSANPNEGDLSITRQFHDQLFLRSRSVVSRVIAGETLIVPVRGKVGDLASIYSFNSTGTLIWQLLDAPRRLDELVDAVEQEYEVARDQAESDVKHFLNDLFLADLVEAPKQSAHVPRHIETEPVASAAV